MNLLGIFTNNDRLQSNGPSFKIRKKNKNCEQMKTHPIPFNMKFIITKAESFYIKWNNNNNKNEKKSTSIAQHELYKNKNHPAS